MKITADKLASLCLQYGLKIEKTANLPQNIGRSPELVLEQAIKEGGIKNATFYSFKPGGKFYTSGRGYVPRSAFIDFHGSMRERILHANDGAMPGLSGPCPWMHHMVILDDMESKEAYGWPLMLPAVAEEKA